MHDKKKWMALELPPHVLTEVAAEAMRLGATPSSLLEEAWGRSSYRLSEVEPASSDVTRMATRIVLKPDVAQEIEASASDHNTSVSALLGWAWQQQRSFYRTRTSGSLIAITD